ncbi:MAG: dipeptidase [Bryobacteraceae bacterium]
MPVSLVLACLLAQADPRFDRLMRDILIFDAHIDTPRYTVDEGYRWVDEHPYYETDVPRLKRGRVGAVLFGVYVEPADYPQSQWLARTLEQIDAFHEEARRNARDVEVALTAADVERIHQSGKIAAMVSLEGGHLILDSPRLLRTYHRLGVRYMTLAHFRTNNWADSATDVAVHNGLSALGRDIVREMNRLGMIVDVSHVSDRTVLAALETSASPVIASHSSAKALCDIPRNMSDDILRAIGRKGGVVCINFHAGYLEKRAYDVYIGNREARVREVKDALTLHAASPKKWEIVRAILQRYYKAMPPVDIRQLLAHIDHVAKVAGPGNVGLGSDFDGISGMVPRGMEDVSKYPALVKGLIEMGYSDEGIRKIMGQNLLRVMRANEAGAAK